MKWNRKTIVLLIVFCVLTWGGAFTLRAQRVQSPPLKFDQPTLLAIQLNVGQGDSLLLISPDQKVTLMDCGPAYRTSSRDWDAGEEVILPTLKGLGLDKIDHIILTHHDQDHLGGILSILNRVPVGRVFDNGRGQLTQTYRHFLDELARCRIPLKTLKEGDEFSLGRLVFAQVLSPCPGEGLDENDTSLVLRVTFGDLEMLLTGDIESLAERDLCARYGNGLHCDFLKVPHHGSKTSSSSSFLRMAQPSVVAISVGRANSYGHPSPAVLRRYEELLESRIFRTDQDGGILFVSNGTECYSATRRLGKLEPVNI